MEAVFFFFRKSQFFSVAFSRLGFVMHGRYHQQIFLKHNLRMCLLACVFLSMSSFFFRSVLHFVRRFVMDSLLLIIMIFGFYYTCPTLESELGTKTFSFSLPLSWMICSKPTLNFLAFVIP